MSALPFTLADMVTPIAESLAAFRTAMGLPQLNGPDGAGTGTLCVGPEYLNFQLAPPGIIIVPSAEELGHEYRTDGVSDGLAPMATKRYLMGAHTFEAWCWGDEDPDFATTQDTLYSFNSALELRREFLLALAQLGGIPAMGKMRGRWEQPANVKRLGRLYVLTFQMWTPIDDLIVGSTVVQPYATATPPGVSIVTTVQAVSPDGTASQTEATITAPPP